jgi:D-arabinose 1-dehydrogenase-like Zn-dependent alcohol dehydrogenase
MKHEHCPGNESIKANALSFTYIVDTNSSKHDLHSKFSMLDYYGKLIMVVAFPKPMAL